MLQHRNVQKVFEIMQMQHLCRISKSYNYILTKCHTQISQNHHLTSRLSKTVLQGWRDNRGDHHLPSRGGEDATARLKLRLRHTAQATVLGGEEGGGGAVQGDQVDRQGRPPVRVPASPGLAVLSECATFKSKPTLWLSDADPLLHPVATMSTAAVEVVRVPRPNLCQGPHRSLNHSADEGPTDDGGVGLPLSYCGARRTSGPLPGACTQPGRSRS